MIVSTIPGFPRIGPNRELKKSIEAYWQGKRSREQLEEDAAALRRAHLRMMLDSGLRMIPVGDFSYYDGMLDQAARLGLIPERYRASETGARSALDLLFAAARGTPELPPLKMTKWFDTNYHYIVPEITSLPSPVPESADPLLALFREAREIVGARAKPTLIGPYTFLRLSRILDGRPFAEHLAALGPVYGLLLSRLRQAGAEWVQIDEPALALSGPIDSPETLIRVYEALKQAASGAASESAPAMKICLQTYFGSVWERRDLLNRLPVDGIGLDLLRGPENWRFLEEPDGSRIWVAGVLDGRNIWRADLSGILKRLAPVGQRLGDRLWIGTSSSLQFLPYSVAAEPDLEAEVRPWLSFALERLQELEVLRRGMEEGLSPVRNELESSDGILRNRTSSSHTIDPTVRAKIHNLTPDDFRRAPLTERQSRQQEAFRLPPLPTTSIGSFPQTPEVRQKRSQFKGGRISAEEYQAFVHGEVEKVIRLQEEIGLDVLVHGEFERSDMVDYFGEQLLGIAVTENGWVQSYGTRCVRPPVIYGDVSRPTPMTVRESLWAQRMTTHPVKGMLTGPVTILNWSFPREDIPRSQVAFQIALALREETRDLETAGIRMIQIDEPAFREGLPLRDEAREAYLQWAVQAFRLASSGIDPATQIHTHMCYSEFNEIISWIAAMDADVISIESSRSGGELLQAFRDYRYAAGIGPGVYDIHSPRVPTVEEVVALLRRTLEVLPAALVWINPDCGLKTREYPEAVASLQNMVEAAREVRSSLPA